VTAQVVPQLTIGMTLLAVGETAVSEMDYRERLALVLPACTSYRTSIVLIPNLLAQSNDIVCAQRLRSG
jgi:hypothetical protein